MLSILWTSMEPANKIEPILLNFCSKRSNKSLWFKVVLDGSGWAHPSLAPLLIQTQDGIWLIKAGKEGSYKTLQVKDILFVTTNQRFFFSKQVSSWKKWRIQQKIADDSYCQQQQTELFEWRWWILSGTKQTGLKWFNLALQPKDASMPCQTGNPCATLHSLRRS